MNFRRHWSAPGVRCRTDARRHCVWAGTSSCIDIDRSTTEAIRMEAKDRPAARRTGCAATPVRLSTPCTSASGRRPCDSRMRDGTSDRVRPRQWQGVPCDTSGTHNDALAIRQRGHTAHSLVDAMTPRPLWRDTRRRSDGDVKVVAIDRQALAKVEAVGVFALHARVQMELHTVVSFGLCLEPIHHRLAVTA